MLVHFILLQKPTLIYRSWQWSVGFNSWVNLTAWRSRSFTIIRAKELLEMSNENDAEMWSSSTLDNVCLDPGDFLLT